MKLGDKKMKNTVTLESIESKIVETNYLIIPNTTITLCSIKLVNGFVVTGEAACVDPANFDEAIGRKFSRQQAIDKIWPLEGYLLAETLNNVNPDGWVLRLKKEYEDLTHKMEKLGIFLHRIRNIPTASSGVSHDKRELLEKQFGIMGDYVDILHARLKLTGIMGVT